MDLFPSSGEGGGAPTLQKSQKLAFPQAMPEQKKSGRWTKSRSLVVMSVTHHRQNPLENGLCLARLLQQSNMTDSLNSIDSG
jgi:hypothetical protein